jgi:lysophospholipase L1-like esterase
MERTEADLDQVVRGLLEAHALPVLVAVGGPFSGRFADMYDRLADRYHVPAVRDVLRQILLDPALKADEVHPNDQGHARLAAAVAETVEPLLRERLRRYCR